MAETQLHATALAGKLPRPQPWQSGCSLRCVAACSDNAAG